MTNVESPTFTVFTATYNRASTLPRLYASLAAQTFRDFEWLIVDDGSTDGTQELVRTWIKDAEFPIRYVRKPNGGKHTAWNVGVAEARGGLFLSLDSDDACVPDALRVMDDTWKSVPAGSKNGFVGCCFLVMNSDGEVIGDHFPMDVFDATSAEMRFRYHVSGEKWGFMRIEVAREFPFPEVEGMRYVPESIVWGRVANRYKERYVNHSLRIYHDDGTERLSAPSWQDARAFALGAQVTLEEQAARWFVNDPKFFAKAGANFSRNSWHCNSSLRDQQRILRGAVARLLWMVMLPVGRALYLRDLRSMRAAGAHVRATWWSPAARSAARRAGRTDQRPSH